MSTSEIDMAAEILVRLKKEGTEVQFESNTTNRSFGVRFGVATSSLTKYEEIEAPFSRKSSALSFSTMNSAKLVESVINVDLSATELSIRRFCQEVASFQISYEDKFHTPCDINTYASEKLVEKMRETFFLLDKTQLPPALSKKPELKEQLQLSLMSLLKQLLDLEIENLARKYRDIPLETHKSSVLGVHFKDLGSFQTFICTSNKYLGPFRYLFPLADPGHEVPDALKQSRIKPFINQVEAVFKLTFFEKKPASGCRPAK